MRNTDNLFNVLEAWEPLFVPYVLVVESDSAIASLLHYVLSHEMRQNTMLTATLREALNVTRAIKPLFFLIDTHLCDGDGITLYDQLHRQTGFEDIPAIILSTSMRDYQQELESRHLIGLDLPFTVDTLIQAVESILIGRHCGSSEKIHHPNWAD